MPSSKLFFWFMWMVAFHSFCVGIALVFIPSTSSVIDFFGYPPCENNFFQKQGGIFHFVMVLLYILAAYRYKKEAVCVYLSLAAKAIAVIFLFTYFFLAVSIWSVLVSGVFDLLMGITIWVLYRKARASFNQSQAT